MLGALLIGLCQRVKKSKRSKRSFGAGQILKMFSSAAAKRFAAHVRELRGDAARERIAKRAAEREARLEAMERQTISIWRVQNGHPIEIIHQR